MQSALMYSEPLREIDYTSSSKSIFDPLCIEIHGYTYLFWLNAEYPSTIKPIKLHVSRKTDTSIGSRMKFVIFPISPI